jgi:large subunit ribosomal protein L4
MAQITLKDATGADAGNVELDDAVFGVQPNVPLMHQVVTAQLANRRAGTQSTKTRSEVRGGGAKPYRQKGTGNARQGSNRSPQFTGGGIALGPKPRGYAQRTPKKMIKAALRSALSDRANEGKVVVVDRWGFDAPRTRDARAALEALGVEGRVLVVIEDYLTPAALSFRNLPEVQLVKAGELNAYDVLCNDWILFEQALLPTATPTETGPSTDDTQSVNASAPDRSTDETAAAEGSASDEAESSEERSDGEDNSE